VIYGPPLYDHRTGQCWCGRCSLCEAFGPGQWPENRGRVGRTLSPYVEGAGDSDQIAYERYLFGDDGHDVGGVERKPYEAMLDVEASER
jgi:hypothetical protein